MSTKKIVIVVVVVALTLGILALTFVAGIVGIAFYTIGNSEAAVTAKKFLRENERLKQDIGEVTDFGTFVTGSVNVENNDGSATLNLKVIGERRTIQATVVLTYRAGRPWRVTAATYKNEAGQEIDLVGIYESRVSSTDFGLGRNAVASGPFIVDCQFPIGFWRIDQLAIGNWKSAIL